MSSLVTLTTRGLPLPVFKLTPVGGTSASVNPDTWVPFAFELTNQGAPDRWNLTSTGSAAGLWSFYRDDGDGIYEYPGSPSECSGTCDTILTNTNPSVDAIVDTGRIDPTASIVFWAVRNVSEHAAEGVYASSITATSAAQSGAASASATVDVLVDVTEDAVVTTPGGGPLTSVPGAPGGLQLTTGDGQLTASWQAADHLGQLRHHGLRHLLQAVHGGLLDVVRRRGVHGDHDGADRPDQRFRLRRERGREEPRWDRRPERRAGDTRGWDDLCGAHPLCGVISAPGRRCEQRVHPASVRAAQPLCCQSHLAGHRHDPPRPRPPARACRWWRQSTGPRCRPTRTCRSTRPTSSQASRAVWSSREGRS